MDDIFGDYGAEEYAPLSTEYEPNDTYQTAAPIGEGSHTVTGQHIDWFEIEALSGEIAIDMTPLTESAGRIQNMNMSLYRDPEGNAIAADLQPGDTTESIRFLGGQADTYYLKVLWTQYPTGDHPDGVDFGYRLDINLPEEMPSDGNDTLETAAPLAEGTTTHSGTNIDWHRIDTLSGEINVSLSALQQPDGSFQNLNLALFDEQGNVVRAGSGDEITETLSHLSASDATYYLRVLWARYPDGAPNGVTLDYQLTLDLPEAQASDGNDTRATARPVGTGVYDVNGTDVDWYRIDTGPGRMDFTLTAAEQADGSRQDLNLILYDSEGNGVRSNLNDGAVESFGYNALGEDTYYLRVNWDRYPSGTPNGLTMDYQLALDLPEGTWAKALDFGPVRGASVAAYDIDRDGVDELFVGTSKSIDAEGNEVRPAGLIAMEADGRVKWTKTFAAAEGADLATGKTYQTTSVSTAPTFSDLDGDGEIDLVVGVGADNGSDDFEVVGQPGDKGGLYALNADGSEKWFFETRNAFGDDNRSDGVYGSPRVFDIDADGVREVLFTSWDHYLYILDGRTGALERELNLHDTAGATPGLADLNGDGLYELVVPSDITSNDNAGISTQGGILQVLSNYGIPNVEGWTEQIGTTTSIDFRGKFEEQSLWSSPKIVDLDGDGSLEIVQGTGDFFKDERGQYVKIWNADGTLRARLDTNGRVLAAPLIADLDGNGSNEIVAVTTSGDVHAWTASGRQLFDTKVMPTGNDESVSLQIVNQAVAVDLDNDGDLEIMVSVGNQMIALDSDGTQISGTTEADRVFNSYTGSPLVKDIDGDGRLDLISGGTRDSEQAMVFRFEDPFDVTADTFRTAAYQGNQSLHEIRAFVDRFYDTILGREADPTGSNSWTDLLYSGVRSGADVARGFVFSQEFSSQGTSREQFVETLYAAFFDRPADAGGLQTWVGRLEEGWTRPQVLDGFIYSNEFGNIADAYGIRVDGGTGEAVDAALITGSPEESDVLRGGSRDNTIYDEGGSVLDTRPDKEAAGQVFRLYGATLGRSPDANGFEHNVESVLNRPLEAIARGFVEGAEFQATYGDLNDEDFVTLLYQNVLGRTPDSGGLETWVSRLEAGDSRASVVLGFSESAEYRSQTNPELDSFVRAANLLWTDVIEGGAGNDTMNGGFGSDLFVFRADEAGTDVIHGFEPWDQLQLSGFGFETGEDAMQHMSRSGRNVVFSHAGQTITFTETRLIEMERVRYNLS